MDYIKKYLFTLMTVVAIIFFGRAKFNSSSSSAFNTASGGNVIIPNSVTPPANVTPSGNWKDGTYTGQSFDAYYGTVQVKVTISNGKITDVSFLNYPQDNRTSARINSNSTVLLKNETIQSQSSQVNAVTGASFTSQAFNESLQSALSQARQ